MGALEGEFPLHFGLISIGFYANFSESTLPETNIAPENQWLEDEISFWDTLFSEPMFVSGRVNQYQFHPVVSGDSTGSVSALPLVLTTGGPIFVLPISGLWLFEHHNFGSNTFGLSLLDIITHNT